MLHNQSDKARRLSLSKAKGKFVVAGIAAVTLGGAVMLSEPVSVQAEEGTQQTSHRVWRARTVEEVRMDVSQYDTLEELRDYEFVWGDTLWAVSQAVGFSVDELAETFNIANPDLIFADYTFGEQEGLKAASAPKATSSESAPESNATSKADDNVNDDADVADNNEEASSNTGSNNQSSEPASESEDVSESEPAEDSSEGDVSSVDADGNGTVNIKEAEDAGFVMPIKEGHWLYPHMIDRDSDGMVGE